MRKRMTKSVSSNLTITFLSLGMASQNWGVAINNSSSSIVFIVPKKIALELGGSGSD